MLHVDMSAYEDALEMQHKMQELANEFAEQIRPAMEAAKSIASSTGIQAAMRAATEQAEIFSRIKKEQAEQWSRILQTIDPGPIFAFSLHGGSRSNTNKGTAPIVVDEQKIENIEERDELIIDQISNDATELLEENVTKLHEDGILIIHLLLTEDGFLLNEDAPEKKRKLTPQMCRLLKALKSTYVATAVLTEKSGYKNDEVTRRGIQKLNRMAFSVLKMTVSIAVGEKYAGYRLAQCIRIRRRWSE